MNIEAPRLAVPRPRVIVYGVVSADGKTAPRTGCSSNPMMDFEDELIRRYRHALRSMADAVMVGSGTIRTDDPYLTVRHVSGRSPLRVIPNSRGDLPLTSKVLNKDSETLVAVSEAASSIQVANLRSMGASVVTVGAQCVDLSLLLQHLYKQGIETLLVEGGAKLLSSFFQLRLVDRLLIQHVPMVLGGSNTSSMVGGDGLADIRSGYPLRLLEVQAVGEHAVIVYEQAEVGLNPMLH